MILPANPPKNAFPAIVSILGENWTEPMKVAAVVGYQLKLAGIDYRTNEEFSKILAELHSIGFLEAEISSGSILKVRVNPIYSQGSVPSSNLIASG